MTGAAQRHLLRMASHHSVASSRGSKEGLAALRSPLLRSPSPASVQSLGHAIDEDRASSRGRLSPTHSDPGPMCQARSEPPMEGRKSSGPRDSTVWNWRGMWSATAQFRRATSPAQEFEADRPGLVREFSARDLYEEELEVVTALERFNRLSSDLANERTLLAWIRTCLAAVRTGVSFLGLAAISDWWFSLMLAQWSMIILIILGGIVGAARYYRIKAMLEYKVPPREFGRLSLTPLNALVAIGAVATAAGLAAHAWVKG